MEITIAQRLSDRSEIIDKRQVFEIVSIRTRAQIENEENFKL